MPTSAFLNHGRWVIQCPACNMGWLVSPAAPMELYDVQGGTHDVCFCGWRGLVVFPEDKDLIDRVTSYRLRPDQRNWYPGESLLELRLENVLHGDGVPDASYSPPGSHGSHYTL